MASYDDEMLGAAAAVLKRRKGQKGRLPDARVRRSISTSYYALFHFLAEEVTGKLIGVTNDVRVRRRLLTRTIAHAALRLTFEKVQGATIHVSVQTFFERDGVKLMSAPQFAQAIARTFLDAQAKREEADYDRNAVFSETDARVLRVRVKKTIRLWRVATSPSDRDFKRAFAVLVLLGGKLR
jgi:hypothetical protein